MVSLRPQRGAGFTLIELMIAGLVASILVVALMSLMIMTTRSVTTQEDSTRTVDRLYYATELVRQDLLRTGYGMGLVPSAVSVDVTSDAAWHLEDCNNIAGFNSPITWEDGPTTDLEAGVTLSVIDAAADPDNTAMGEQPDRLTLVGPFRSPVLYGDGDSNFLFSSTGSAITLLPGTGWGGFSAGDATAVAHAFTDSLAAIHNINGGVRYQQVTSATASGTTVSLALANVSHARIFTDRCTFINGVETYAVIPLQIVRWELIDDPFSAERTILSRTLVAANGDVVGRMPVARNIVDFQVWFDRAGAPSQPVDVDPDGADQTDAAGTLTTSMRIEEARYAYVQLTARLDNESADLARAALDDRGGLQVSVDVDGDPSSSARLITVRIEVPLQSLAMADVR